jgi:hypothetical protein
MYLRKGRSRSGPAEDALASARSQLSGAILTELFLRRVE